MEKMVEYWYSCFWTRNRKRRKGENIKNLVTFVPCETHVIKAKVSRVKWELCLWCKLFLWLALISCGDLQSFLLLALPAKARILCFRSMFCFFFLGGKKSSNFSKKNWVATWNHRFLRWNLALFT
jgi:hypothetical protein